MQKRIESRVTQNNIYINTPLYVKNAIKYLLY